MTKVEFGPEAASDFRGIYLYILENAGAVRAGAFIARVEHRCDILAMWPKVGSARPDIAPNVRLIGIGRRVTILYRHLDNRVVVDRILYAGRQP